MNIQLKERPLPDEAESDNQQPDSRPEAAAEELRAAELELSQINDRLDQVRQGIEEAEKLVSEHPEMVALNQELEELREAKWAARDQARRNSFEVAVAGSARDHEQDRAEQYEEEIKNKHPGVQAADEAHSEAVQRWLRSSVGGAEDEELWQRSGRLGDQARAELAAAIEADPGARSAQQRHQQAISRHVRLEFNADDSSPLLKSLEEREDDVYDQRRDLDRRIWAENPDAAARHQALQAERWRLWDRQTKARKRLKRATESLGQTEVLPDQPAPEAAASPEPGSQSETVDQPPAGTEKAETEPIQTAKEPEATPAPDPNRSPILDPKNRSPLLPPLRQPASGPDDVRRHS